MHHPPQADQTDRLRLLHEAVSLGGSYLARSNLEWASSRRYELDVVREETLLEVAKLGLEESEYEMVKEHCGSLLEIDPYNEECYQILIMAEQKVGTPTSQLAIYRRTVDALKEIGLTLDRRTMELMKETS